MCRMTRDELPRNRVTVRSRALGRRLREVRERRKISGRALGQRLGLSHSTVSFWETGQRTPTTEEVAAVLAALHVVGEERDEILALARKAYEAQWLIRGAEMHFLGVVECERAASEIVNWQPTVVPGLLQTAEYTYAIMRAAGANEQEAQKQVRRRVARREILERVNPVQYKVFIDEYVLRVPILEPEGMRRQVEHLLMASRRSNIHLRVLPAGQSWHPGLAGAFILHRFGDQEPVLYLEHYWTGAFETDPEIVGAYFSAVDTIAELALSQEESRAFLQLLR